MSDILESKNQTYRIQFKNDRDSELEFWLEPDGMCFSMPPQTTLEVAFSQSETTELTINFDKDNNFTLYNMSPTSVFQNKKMIYPDWQIDSNEGRK